jgi:hypothetical protein
MQSRFLDFINPQFGGGGKFLDFFDPQFGGRGEFLVFFDPQFGLGVGVLRTGN